MTAGYGLCVYIYTAIVRILWRVSTTDRCKAVDRSCRDCAEIVLSPHPCIEKRKDIARHPCGFRTEAVQRSYGGCVILMYFWKFVYQTCTTTHFYLRWHFKRVKQNTAYLRQLTQTLTHRKPAQFPYHFTGTARAPCGNLVIAVRGPYDYRKSLRSLRDFLLQNDQLKPCILRTIAVRCPYGNRAMLLRRVYGLMIFKFLYNSELNKIVEATATLRHPKTVWYRTASIWRPHRNVNLGIVQSP